MANKMKAYAINTILSKAFSDYTLNQASDNEINALVEASEVVLDEAYLDFLQLINGFELNGLNFYGTREQPNIYVLDVLKQNSFWNGEIPSLKPYFLIADGDMDFYCFDSEAKNYCAFTKATLTKVEVYDNFEALLGWLIKTY